MAFMAGLDACSAGERHLSMLEVRGLGKAFNTLTVAYQVSLIVPRGGRHAVIGPNGAGKTTLFNMICGAVVPDAGMIMIDDVDVTLTSPCTDWVVFDEPSHATCVEPQTGPAPPPHKHRRPCSQPAPGSPRLPSSP